METTIFENEVLLVHLRDELVSIEIRRPRQLNALNFEVLSSLRDSLSLLNSEDLLPQVKVCLIRGAGEKAFVAGADIKLMLNADAQEQRAFIELGQSVMCAIEQFPRPVIAVVQGFALGGGLELALACDLILASEQAKFGQPEVNLGLLPGFGGSQRLQERCGPGVARRLIYTGEMIGASEALQLGLIEYLSPADNLEERVQDLVSTLLKKSPLALAAAKRAINSASDSSKRTGLQIEVDEFLRLIQTEDAREGMQAFTENRSAQFRGR